jgi:hypothetical protein
METTTATGYCVKCKAQRDIKDAKTVTLQNGTSALKGACVVCGTAITRFVPKKA